MDALALRLTPPVSSNLENMQLRVDAYVYVEEEKIPDYLLCIICCRPFINPVEHPACGNEFCEKCVSCLKTCPTCRQSTLEGEFKLVTSKRLLRPLGELKVVCPTCDGHVERFQLDEHMACCKKVVCRHGCGFQFVPKDIAAHELQCPAEVISCPAIETCRWMGQRSLFEDHDRQCPTAQVHRLRKQMGQQNEQLELQRQHIATQQERIDQLQSQVQLYEMKNMALEQQITLLKHSPPPSSTSPSNSTNTSLKLVPMMQFVGAPLQGYDFSYTDLTSHSFQGANLMNGNLRGSNLTHANFRGAVLKGADLSGTIVHDCNFIGADLREAKMDNMTGIPILTGARFK